MSDLPPLPTGATLNPLPADLPPLPPGATLNPVSADAALPPLPPGAKLNPVAPPPGATEKPQETTSTFKAPLTQGTPPADPLAPQSTPMGPSTDQTVRSPMAAPSKGFVAPLSQKPDIQTPADEVAQLSPPRAYKDDSPIQDAIGAAGEAAMAKSPWMGKRAASTTPEEVLRRSDARAIILKSQPDMDEKRLNQALSIGSMDGVKNMVGGLIKSTAEMAPAVPAVMRLFGTGVDEAVSSIDAKNDVGPNSHLVQ